MNEQSKFNENCYSTDGSDSLYDIQNKGHTRSAERQIIKFEDTDDQRIRRLEQKRLRVIENRSNETDDQRSQRLQQERLRVIKNRSNESDDQRSQRLEQQRLREIDNRSNEDDDQRRQRLHQVRLRVHENRSNESDDQLTEIGDEFDDLYLIGRRSPEPNDTDFYDNYNRPTKDCYPYYKNSLFPKSHIGALLESKV